MVRVGDGIAVLVGHCQDFTPRVVGISRHHVSIGIQNRDDIPLQVLPERVPGIVIADRTHRTIRVVVVEQVVIPDLLVYQLSVRVTVKRGFLRIPLLAGTQARLVIRIVEIRRAFSHCRQLAPVVPAQIGYARPVQRVPDTIICDALSVDAGQLVLPHAVVIRIARVFDEIRQVQLLGCIPVLLEGDQIAAFVIEIPISPVRPGVAFTVFPIRVNIIWA